MLILSGDVPSKKNSKRRVFAHGRFLMIPSKAHEAWHRDASAQLAGARPVPCPASVTLTFYPSTRRRGDLSNKAESVMDLLVDRGVIEDDNWFAVPRLSLQFGGVDRQNPRVEVEFSPPSQAQPGC